MAFLFSDGFDSYAATADLTKKGWSQSASNWTWSSSGGVTSGGAITTATTAGNTISRQLKAANSSQIKLFFSLWVKLSALPASNLQLAVFYGGGSLVGGGVGITTAGLVGYVTNAGSVIAGSGSNICDNVWHHIEVDMLSSSTEDVYVDSVRVMNGVNVGIVAGADSLVLKSLGTGVTVTVDDTIAWDDTGSGLTTGPMGVRRIDTIRPTGAGNSAQFTPDSGSNYARVLEANADDDTSYVASSTSAQKDTYAFGDLGTTPTTVTAVVVNARARTDAGKAASIKMRARSSTTEANGVNGAQALAASYAMKQDIFVVDPNTSAAWAGAGVNAAEFGIEVS